MTHSPHRRRGFTLIEVLIGVLILALGLLGLGAIIPVVVREQRNAAEATLGVAAANSAQAYLTRQSAANPGSTDITIWDFLRFNAQWGAKAATNDGVLFDSDLLDGTNPLWLFDTRPVITQSAPRRLYNLQTAPGPSGLNAILLDTFVYRLSDPATGAMLFDVGTFRIPSAITGTGSSQQYASRGREVRVIPLGDRLWPSPAQRTAEELGPRDPYRPQFVWDFVARRVPPARVPRTRTADEAFSLSELPVISTDESLQVAVFVRRVDQNIRVPSGTNSVTNEPYKLFDLLTWRLPGGATDPNRRLPVAIDADALPTNAGFDPRNAGTDPVYSPIISLRAQFDPQNRPERNIILVDSTSHFNTFNAQQLRRLARLVAQPGQKIVDNLGNVYTVRGVATPEEVNEPQFELFVDPPVPESVLRADQPGGAVVDDPTNPNVLRQIVFTPQIPAAVRVFTITRPVNTP